jgi:hypothetical protein
MRVCKRQRTGNARRWLPSIVAVCLICGPLIAGEVGPLEEPRETFARVRGALGAGGLNLTNMTPPSLGGQGILEHSPVKAIQARGFLKRHLMPRVSQQLEGMVPIHTLDFERAEWQQSELHGWFSGTASYFATRGLKRAARAFLVEETAVGPFLESLHFHGRASSGPAKPRSSTSYGVHVSHGIPALELRHLSAAGATRFGIGLDGSVALEFRPAHSTNGRFAVGYDANVSAYGLNFRHSF